MGLNSTLLEVSIQHFLIRYLVRRNKKPRNKKQWNQTHCFDDLPCTYKGPAKEILQLRLSEVKSQAVGCMWGIMDSTNKTLHFRFGQSVREPTVLLNWFIVSDIPLQSVLK